MGNENIHSICHYCRSVNSLICRGNFNFDEVYPEGEGTVKFLACGCCGAEVQYSIRTDEIE